MQATWELPFTYKDYYGMRSTSVKIIITDIRNDEQKTRILEYRMPICVYHNPTTCCRIYQSRICFLLQTQNYSKQIRLMVFLPQTRPILGNTCTGTCTQFAATNSIFLTVYCAYYKISSYQDKRFGHIEWCQSLAFWELMSTVVSNVWENWGQK